VEGSVCGGGGLSDGRPSPGIAPGVDGGVADPPQTEAGFASALRSTPCAVDLSAGAAVAAPIVVPSRRGANAPRFLRASLGDPTTGGTFPGARDLWISWTSNNAAGVPTVEFELAASPAALHGAEWGGGGGSSKADEFPNGFLNGFTGGPRRGSATGSSVTYSAADMCEAPANVSHDPWGTTDPGWQHHVLVPNVPPGSSFKYRVGLTAANVSVAAAGPASAAGSTSFDLLGGFSKVSRGAFLRS
jgi:hypothetical protein